jgi:glycosyltransferase involved in cell wall biosynthesis
MPDLAAPNQTTPAPIDPGQLTRMDMHCHSRASSKPVNKAVGFLGIAESYSPPEKVYDQARARGMDLVTITDHDTCAGAIELHERGFQGFVIGQEVSVFFPEDRCLIHVTVWDLTPDLAVQIDEQELRSDVYKFAHWLAEHDLPHAFAHPLYIQNSRLALDHLERCALLFKGWEVLNGAHPVQHREVVELFLDRLTPNRIAALSRRHGLAPLWDRAWQKGRTAGSDDHALLNVGKAWLGIPSPGGAKITSCREFLDRAMRGEGVAGGVGGHPALHAHQLMTVAAQWYARRADEELSSAESRYLASKLLRFAGAPLQAPSKAELVAGKIKQKVVNRFRKRKSRTLPIVKALKKNFSEVIDRYPDLKAKFDPSTWDDGPPTASHERMAEFADDMCSTLSAAMASDAVKAFRKRDTNQIVDHLISYAVVTAAQLPYMFSLFYQNKERNMLELVEHEVAEPGSGRSVLERGMRVCLLTDTLGDVNGVSRFIQNVAWQAMQTGRDLEVITSTNFEIPDWPNITNFKPVYATRMPRYEQLELVLPPLLKMLRYLDKRQPDVMHISTPGTIGLIGYIGAKMLRIPVMGVYHTDFPAYIDRFFDDPGMTRATEWFMKFFYEPFRSIFTRSEDYVGALVKLGIPREKTLRLMPGIETARFNTGYRDMGVWKRIEDEGDPALRGLSRPTVRALYVGRVSVEKNMPLLEKIWRRVDAACQQEGLDAELIVVGDGPYKKHMQGTLKNCGVRYLGFRHGDELATIYASSDLFVFPSTTDTLGQVVMESQSSGLPVLVTTEGGPKEVVIDGQTGYVLDPEDVALWAERILDLIRDPAKRQAMGAAAAASMLPYDIKHSFEHFWQVHEEAWHEHLATLGIRRKPAGESAPSAPPVPTTPVA